MSSIMSLERLIPQSGIRETVLNEDGYPAFWDNIHPILQINVSVFYAPITNTVKKKDLSLFEVYHLIKSDKFKAHTLKLRAIADKRENSEYKKKHFNYATFSGTFKTRNDKDLIHHSHLIAIDLDHLGEKLQEVQLKINAMEETIMAFVSPNGDGLKVIYRIDPVKWSQEQYYKSISDYLFTYCNLAKSQLDLSCKNVSRACFLPFDPNVFLNPKLKQL